ncbi:MULTISPECIES: LysM domain-containing protein [unclassified Lactobacillus]|uniref:LysM peptidoglycan-binding domain-containing protein n=1 Tax=unclassified Lactobacillus TaxID=2620435 RepID=UPI000EFC8093|nr:MULTISPECIES: LysM domain-containing protein [unclassified Lactobacillus]RMC39915.1 LysM peptidoglycan-binding domain-containing protein [Lactobacillus sp. ESL0237]RMC44074.1 LysM peptidoglycan-binding domain-containing protein [Lactobacillus sp. ESL0234]RMC45404.1 LysM peptidoglycan-binding domain-containing protein [Lactobacillus sp. ESL0236]RMC50667.1 LysM peptidoglycan-binding domain-containing protein [Lactobacillus sp. ESL0225]
MSHKPKGPYLHYERPNESRTVIHKATSRGWIVWMAILILSIIALVPVVHHLATNGSINERVVELKKSVKKHDKLKKSVVPQNRLQPKAEQKKKRQPPKVQTKPTQYVAKSGDSLSSIAEKFNLSIEELASLNQLNVDSQVKVNQILKVK